MSSLRPCSFFLDSFSFPSFYAVLSKLHHESLQQRGGSHFLECLKGAIRADLDNVGTGADMASYLHAD